MKQDIKPYDYEKVKSDYLRSQETTIMPRNDGSIPQYAFPIKHQVLRCGKWIPTEGMYYNALRCLYRLEQESMYNKYKDVLFLGFGLI